MSTSASDVKRSDSALQLSALKPLLMLCGSEEVLLLAYIVSVVFGVKPILYVAFAFSLLAAKWRYSDSRLLIWLALMAGIAYFYAKVSNLIPVMTFAVAAMGIFSQRTGLDGSRDSGLIAARRMLLLASVVTLLVSFFVLDRFDTGRSTASHNFIPVAGLYLLLVAEDYPRSLRIIVTLVLAACTFLAGSRSGTAVLALVSLCLFPRRWTPLVIVLLAVTFLVAVDLTTQTQFQRNYFTEYDPRLFIWAEVADAIMNGQFFRQENFRFMADYALERNFHNSFLEGYYRLGVLFLILLAMHFRVIFSGRASAYLRLVLFAMLLKATADTFLWFTPVDLIVFRRYGEQLFAGSNA